jgi:hypothetical protein
MASTTFLIALVGFLSLVTPSLSITDADILNFALNLECLEVSTFTSVSMLES